jgi:hypothetical protein
MLSVLYRIAPQQSLQTYMYNIGTAKTGNLAAFKIKILLFGGGEFLDTKDGGGK